MRPCLFGKGHGDVMDGTLLIIYILFAGRLLTICAGRAALNYDTREEMFINYRRNSQSFDS